MKHVWTAEGTVYGGNLAVRWKWREAGGQFMRQRAERRVRWRAAVLMSVAKGP